MSEMKPVARVDGRWSDGRAMVRTLEAGANMPLNTELYTAEQLAEAVAAERERCLRIVMSEGITPSIPDDPDPVAEAINGALQNVHEAIRSATK